MTREDLRLSIAAVLAAARQRGDPPADVVGVLAAIADEYAAGMVEEHARPPARKPLRRRPGARSKGGAP